uniref:Uncharacterized protein n=1 Tax=Fagus sylvatica TaxID=28930 RepID=A0A2N9HBR8_FAGSY
MAWWPPPENTTTNKPSFVVNYISPSAPSPSAFHQSGSGYFCPSNSNPSVGLLPADNPKRLRVFASI